MRGPLEEPVAFPDHLERSKRLLPLVVIVQLPRQIRYGKQAEDDRADHPNRARTL